MSAISGNKEKEEKGRSLLSFDQQVASVDGTLRALFDLLDANHDSQLSKVEVMKGLMLQSSEVANILQETKALTPLRHPKAWSGAFKAMDTNCDGHVTLEELRSFVVGIISISTTNDAASKSAKSIVTYMCLVSSSLKNTHTLHTLTRRSTKSS